MKKLCMGLLVLPFLFACGTKVERLDTHEIKDVSGRWNDTDSQMVAQEMINDCLNSGWYNKATLRLGKEPTVIVGTVPDTLLTLSGEDSSFGREVYDLESADPSA